MPLELSLHYEDGNVTNLKGLELGDTFVYYDFFEGRLSRVIGVESPIHDMFGIVHVIEDEETLETLCPANLVDKFAKKAVREMLLPNAVGQMEVSDREGRCASLIMDHTLPESTSLN